MALTATKRKVLKGAIVLLTALFLILSFGMHIVDFSHTHPGDHSSDGISSSLSMYLHGNDRKYWLTLVATLVFMPCFMLVRKFLLSALRSSIIRRLPIYVNDVVYSIFISPLLTLLRAGILHPKIYG